MSNFSRAAYNPVEDVVRMANYIDDYFGKHKYGVHFPGDPDDRVYKPEDVEIPLTTIFVPKHRERK